MNDTFDRLSGDMISMDDDSVNSNKRGGNMGMEKTKGGARKMTNAWDLFEKGGDIAPRKKRGETYSDLADEDEKEAVFNHSIQRGGLFGQIADSPLKEYLPNKFKNRMPDWAKNQPVNKY